ncbi:MAG: hypothetical protein IIA72_11165 [Proteobacteria bacterium]|nr:hypothetical protein [Pseudomonadota bacterium]
MPLEISKEDGPLQSRTWELDRHEGSLVQELKDASAEPLAEPTIEVPADLKSNLMITSVDALVNWSRKSALWPVSFGLACCAFEMIASAMGRFDIARFGMEAFRASPRQADLMIFSVHGSEANCYDLPSMVYLPELLYRYSFAGRRYLCRNQLTDGQLPPVRTSMRGGWLQSVWEQKATTTVSVLSLRQWRLGRLLLRRMNTQLFSQRRFFSQPLTWFDHRWPKMKAFALPTYGDGYVRINLKGREGRGRVSPADYDTLCDEITDMLNALRNPRNGRPVVKEVVRTRLDRRARGPYEPDADLVVVWQQPPADMVSSPTLVHRLRRMVQAGARRRAALRDSWVNHLSASVH